MKQNLLIILALVLLCPHTWANVCQQGKRPCMSPTKFKEEQKAFIMQNVQLTPKEAARFFPVYFELQDKKRALKEQAWTLIRTMNVTSASEIQCSRALDAITDVRLQADRLEKTYIVKFKKILSAKKVMMVLKAEIRFHREVIRKAHNNNCPN